VATTASVLILQHAPAEGAGLIGEELEARGIATTVVRSFTGEKVPGELANHAGLVVMGGPMGVYEEGRYPFLRDEMRLLEKAIAADLPVLGVCLGSQLLAAVLGAAVTPGARKEIGWHTVTLSDDALADPLWSGLPRSFPALHWHGDVFARPEGATMLASSELTPHQAFRYGRAAYGILFHLEVTPSIVAAMVAAFPDELAAAGIEGAAIVRAGTEHLPLSGERGHRLFGGWASFVASAASSGA